MDLNLSGKNAVVCGSTQGIGKATAIEMALNGANIILISRNEAKLTEVKNILACGSEQHHEYLVAEFADPSNLQSVLAANKKLLQNANILVNNTGGPPGGKAIDAPIEEFRVAFNQHLICNHLLVQACFEGMKTSGYGRIINVISTSVKAPLPNLGVSNTIRGAVANWSKTLANELGEFGITVNNVLPGATDTERLKSIAENKSKKTGKSVDAVLEAMTQQVPLNRVAKPEEVANAITFLASPSGAYINGINVPVDGGRTPSL